jgi:hypothetical protein
VTQSNWCDKNHWYLDNTLSTKSTHIPKDTIDDTNIVKKNYTYVIAENACFQKIPSLVCNNLTIIVGQNVQPNAAGSFICALLEASNVICGKNITLSHWEPNTFCEWTVSSLATSSGCAINYLIIDANSSSGTGLYTEGSSLQNCYIKTNNLYLYNTSVSSSTNYVTKILCTSGTFVSSTINDKVICEGNFSISGNTIFGGSGNGSFIFNENSINAGKINGLTTFNDSSINQGIVYSNVLFSGASSNNGIIVGDCVFLNGTKNLGTVSGNALFSDSSINSGTIINNSFFNSGSINAGIVSGISKLDYAINNGTISESYFTHSINSTDGIVTGISVFNQSINNGLLNNKYINFSFINNSINNGTISGSVTFDSGCINSNIITNSSGTVIFRKNSINNGNIEGNHITFTDDSENNHSIINSSGLTIFSKNAINNENIIGSGSVEFYNSSLNNTNGTFNSGNFYYESTNSGTLNIAYFYQNAANFKTVNSGIFNDYSINKPEGSGNNLCFNNNAINFGFAGIGSFANNAQNYGTGYSLQFCHKAINASGGTSLNYIVFWGNSTNLSGSINNEFANFHENSKNYSNSTPDCRFIFHDRSVNYANVYSGIFKDFSKNSINTTGYNLNFYDNSTNHGTITNLGLFNDRSSNKGTLFNTGIFYNLSSNQSLGVLQNSLFLDYSSNISSYQFDHTKIPITIPQIIFSGYSINKGNIVDSYVQFGDHASNQNTISWNSTLLFTSSGIFFPELDNKGKIIYRHFSGPNGTYETDVDEFIRTFYRCAGSSSDYSWPQIIFNDYSTNSGNLIGYYNYIFNSGSSNYGYLNTYPVIPNLHTVAFFDGALNFESIVNGKTSFINSINSGTVLFPYFENSINYGDLIGSPTEQFYLCNDSYLDGVSVVEFINSTNFGRMNLFGSFNNSINFGNINSNASFNLGSINRGTVVGDGEFINGSCNSGTVLGTITTDNTCSN